jgi:hypothetical protein
MTRVIHLIGVLFPNDKNSPEGIIRHIRILQPLSDKTSFRLRKFHSLQILTLKR